MATKDPDFVIARSRSRYEEIPTAIECVTGFSQSPEWLELGQNDLEELSGVVLGALRRFLLRIGTEAESQDQLISAGGSEGFAFIEELVVDNERELCDAVVNEVFEPLEPGTAATRGFYERLGPASRRLYDQHCIAVV